MHNIRLMYKDLTLSFESENEDPIQCLALARAKAAEVARALRDVPEYRQLTPKDFEYHVDWREPQLPLFGRPSGDQTVLVVGPKIPTLASLSE